MNGAVTSGIKDILALKASLNLGLPPQLQSAFPNLSPIPRPIIKEPIPDPNWLSGFLCAEGFHDSTNSNTTVRYLSKVGYFPEQ